MKIRVDQWEAKLVPSIYDSMYVFHYFENTYWLILKFEYDEKWPVCNEKSIRYALFAETKRN